MAPGLRPTALGAPYNEVKNPSFERDFSGWSFDTSVYPIYNGDWGPAVWERSQDFAARRGSWSARLRVSNITGNPATTGPFLGPYFELPAVEGDIFTVAMDVNVVQDPRSFNAYLQFFDKNGVELSGAAPTVGWSMDWYTEAGVLLTSPTYRGRLGGRLTHHGSEGCPAGTAKVRVWPLSYQGHAGDTFDVYVDNVTAVRHPRPSVDDTFATNTLANYTVLVGSGTLAVSGGALRPTSTAVKLLYNTSIGAVLNFPRVTSKVVFGTTVANYEGSPAIRIQSDGSCAWAGYESGFLKIFERAAGGTSTSLGSVAVTAPTAGQTFWISLTAVYEASGAERYLAEWWTTDPALGGSPAHSVKATTSALSGTGGFLGLYWAGVHSSLTSAVDDLKIDYWTTAASDLLTVAVTPQATFTGDDAGKGWEGEEGASRSGTGTAFVDPFVLHPRALEALNSIPPVFREDPDVRAVLYAQGREAERQEAQMDDLLLQLDPVTATEEGLVWFETLLKTAVAPAGKTVQQRRDVLVNRMSRVAGEPAGSGWETAVSEILGVLGTDWDYAEYVGRPQVNMIHNPKAVSNGFGTMTWWGGGYSNGGAGTAKAAGSDPRFFGQGLNWNVNTAGIPGGTAGESMTISSGTMGVSPNEKQWYAFRCEYKVGVSVGYGIPSLVATFSNLSSTVRGTAVMWSGVRNLDLDLDGQYHVVEGYVKQPVNGAGDTQRLTVAFVFPVITTGPTSGNFNMTLGRFVMTPVAGPDTPIVPDYFDGDTDHYQWTSLLASPDNDTSQTRSSSTPSTLQVRVPYFAFDPTTDPKMMAVRDLTASHLDMEVLYSETI